QNSVVIWTRVTPQYQVSEVTVKWEVSADVNFNKIIQSGTTTTSPKRDYTVKEIVSSLKPNTIYYYRFSAFNVTSMTGKTKTLPTDDSQVKLAVASCSNIEFGYFNAYAAMSDENVNAVIHLGDYIYEYGPDVYGDKSFSRKNIPPHEIITLQDYRDRYSQYRLDPDLIKAHASVPFINVWDDHEITNNAYIDGAQNHQDDEGSYDNRKNIAKQVFYEWLPIRETEHHYRKFRFGNAMELFMLDERLAGRTAQADSITDPRRFSNEQKLLGDQQMEWLIDNLKSSTTSWKVLGNQVIFSYSDWGYEGFSQNMDAWDGYPNDQKRLTEAIQKNNIDNLIFVTGDTHTAWAFEATSDPFETYNPKTSEGAIGVEFGVTSITSGNSNERHPTDVVKKHEMKIANSDVNPHLKYVNMRDHGYLILTLDSDKVEADFKIVTTLKERDTSVKSDKKFVVKKGSTKLIGKL
ncbi:MAG: alkaline phosphatase D family protein, partial [Saprospiraceae bacterium]|nr:alkaline phosphatase D family protein [Saprospiraceae bacterium]